MKSPVIALVVFVSLSGCSPKVLDEFERFADRACACADRACGEKVQAEFLAWSEKNRYARGSERKRAEDAAKRWSDCTAKLGVGAVPAASAETAAPLVPAAAAPAPSPGSAPPSAGAGENTGH